MPLDVGLMAGLTQAVARVLGLSRAARIKRSLAQTFELYGRLPEKDVLLEAARNNLANVINIHSEELLVREFAAANRSYDWGALTGAVFLAGLFALPLIWTIPPRGFVSWTVTIIFAGLA